MSEEQKTICDLQRASVPVDHIALLLTIKGRETLKSIAGRYLQNIKYIKEGILTWREE